MRSIHLLVLLALVAPAPAFAGIPSPINSTVPPCFFACPAGDLAFQIVVRDIGNNPIAGSTVVLDFADCPGFVVCPANGSELYIWDPATRWLRWFTDASGTVRFAIRGGGTCAAGQVRVLADGVRMAMRSLASPDQDGSLLVDGADALHVNSLLGSADPTADLDCDGTVTNTDLSILTNQHGGHSCTNVVPARPRSWGSLKQIYR